MFYRRRNPAVKLLRSSLDLNKIKRGWERRGRGKKIRTYSLDWFFAINNLENREEVT
jgi:hypothetical protein